MPKIKCLADAIEALTMSNKNGPDLGAIVFTFGETDTRVRLITKGYPPKMIDLTMSKVTSDAVERAIRTMCGRDEIEEQAQALVNKMASNGFVYVENMPNAVVNLFKNMWSDAYGEDLLLCFLKPVGTKHVTGFIKTNMTAAQIAAKNQEE